MKTLVIILFALVAATGSGFGQKLIAVQNGGEPKFFTELDSAIVNALNGDTIYIPGGVFQNIAENTLTINKELHLIGAGHYPDSTRVTNPTYIKANIVVVSGANKSTFEGFYLTDFAFVAGSSTLDEDVDDITISRCFLVNLYLSRLKFPTFLKPHNRAF